LVVQSGYCFATVLIAVNLAAFWEHHTTGSIAHGTQGSARKLQTSFSTWTDHDMLHSVDLSNAQLRRRTATSLT